MCLRQRVESACEKNYTCRRICPYGWPAAPTKEKSRSCRMLTRGVLTAGIDPVLIVAPRDPGRARTVCNMFNRFGGRCQDHGADRTAKRTGKGGGDRPHWNPPAIVCLCRCRFCRRQPGRSGRSQSVGTRLRSQADSFRSHTPMIFAGSARLLKRPVVPFACLIRINLQTRSVNWYWTKKKMAASVAALTRCFSITGALWGEPLRLSKNASTEGSHDPV